MSNQNFSSGVSSEKSKSRRQNSEVNQRHLILREQYIQNPDSALITDSSEVVGTNLRDPFRTSVLINEHMKVPFKVGVHRAVGGDHDFPNPGDILCAALASCFESTIRMISNKLGYELIETRIKATALVDVRGTLMIDNSVPVGFQSMNVKATVIIKDSTDKKLKTLIQGAEHCCIVYQTIKQGTPITLDFKFG